MIPRPDPRTFPPAACRLAFAVALAVLASLAPARGDDAPGAARLKAMRAIADEATLEAGPEGARVKVERVEDPVYRFDDPTRITEDGTVWAWGRPGRPVALLTLSALKPAANRGGFVCEWTSLTTAPIAANGPGPHAWAPRPADLTPRPFTDAPAPAATAAGRTRQLGELARSLKAYEVFPPVGEGRENRYDLRLLPRPVHRYADPEAGVIDGGLFVFAFGTNPEVALLIEARRDGTSPPAWTYTMAPIAAAELHAERDGVDVWTRPARPFPAPSDPYFIVVRPARPPG